MMAHLIIQSLEIVEIENQHGRLGLLSDKNIQSFVECFDQFTAVIKSCQRIRFTELAQLPLDFIFVRDVACNPDDSIFAINLEAERLNTPLKKDRVTWTIAGTLYVASTQLIFNDMERARLQRFFDLGRKPARLFLFEHVKHAQPDEAAAVVIMPYVFSAEDGSVTAAARKDESRVWQG
ncbi:hypothetical protein [Agrobacterium tumefaciens]|uniref:hypothetical protein n=1 Tax=Agrobacterium tumefaciens TaxID=358 RepID=UPI0021CF2829|nr:hypothetical protein [Agrobacterium tumefaciens]